MPAEKRKDVSWGDFNRYKGIFDLIFRRNMSYGDLFWSLKTIAVASLV